MQRDRGTGSEPDRLGQLGLTTDCDGHRDRRLEELHRAGQIETDPQALHDPIQRLSILAVAIEQVSGGTVSIHLAYALAICLTQGPQSTDLRWLLNSV